MRSKATLLTIVAVAVLLGASLVAAQGATTTVVAALRHGQQQQLHDALMAVSDPSHASYGKYWTVQQLRSVVAASPAVVEEATQLLTLFGATQRSMKLTATGDYMTAEVPSDAVRALVAEAKARAATGGAIELVFIADPAALQLPAKLDVAAEERFQHYEERAAAAAAAAAAGSAAGKHEHSKLAFGGPNAQRSAYGIPSSQRGSSASNVQMVWGPGTYGFLDSDLSTFYSELNVNETTSLLHHVGFSGTPGGDNFGEGTLDTTYISSMGQGISTLVSNTNKSMSTEEGDGFGDALLHFASALATASDKGLPRVLSMSLGSLSFASCHMLCTQAAPQAGSTFKECWAYMQQQRQVCMFTSNEQHTRISTEFMKLGLRGVTLLGASGDGGSHYSFQPFNNDNMGAALNNVSCTFNFPTYPASDPYVTGVGGTQWSGAPTAPTPWGASGGGFSWIFEQPKYQKAAVSKYLMGAGVPPSYAFNATNRAYPDVAALSSGVPMVVDGNFVLAGGTSASAPSVAGVISLLNDVRLGKGLPPLGFVNPRLYKVAAEHPGEAFYRMSSGTSACNSAGTCCPTGTSFPAAEAWDPITGLGSPLWPGLVKYLTSDSL